MGYYTSFDGAWDITPPLTPAHADYLKAFSAKDNLPYVEAEVAKLPDPLREAVGLPVGKDGIFCLAVERPDDHWTVEGLDLNPPRIGKREGLRIPDRLRCEGAPDSHNRWELVEVAELDGETTYAFGLPDSSDVKFYEYKEWLIFFLKNFFIPWGYKLNGEVRWSGEEREDMGALVLNNNRLAIQEAHIVYETTATWELGDDDEVE